MKTRPNILFLFRKPKRFFQQELAADMPGVIVCRIEVRGKRAMLSTGLKTTYGEWDSAAARLAGRSTAAKQANEQLVKMRDRLTDYAADLDRQGKQITAQKLSKMYQLNGCTLGLLELFEAFMQERETLIGVEISQTTTISQRSRQNRVAAFLQHIRQTDMRPEDFTPNVADRLTRWLLIEKGFQRASANNVLKTVCQVLRWGVRREHLDKSPMEGYQFKAAASKRIKYLNVGELDNLTAAPLALSSLERVRDCFVFQCWTGLAYADLAALNVAASAEYHRDAQGVMRRVLRVVRQKSTLQQGYECVIPLLPEAERLLSKYGDALPVVSNQRYNAYLKQVGAVAGIAADKMTTHVGRKTAGVMMLNLGIRMETVSKFLGHSSVRMTEKVYAEILDTTVVADFGRVFGGTGALASSPVYTLAA